MIKANALQSTVGSLALIRDRWIARRVSVIVYFRRRASRDCLRKTVDSVNGGTISLISILKKSRVLEINATLHFRKRDIPFFEIRYNNRWNVSGRAKSQTSLISYVEFLETRQARLRRRGYFRDALYPLVAYYYYRGRGHYIVDGSYH